MSRSVTVLVGTKKGAYRFKSGAPRERWRMVGHDFAGQPVYHVTFDPRDGRSLFAAINATWGGPRIEVSRDLGATWRTAKNPAFPARSPLTFSRTWHIEPGHASDPKVVWCGTEPAALFRSEDHGLTWEGVPGLNDHSERRHWSPGGGGLGLHSIAIDAVDPRSMMIGISAAGVYESADGGVTWSSANRGSTAVLPAGGETDDLGRCVHHLVAHPVVPGIRFQQNHVGTYFGTQSGSASRGVQTAQTAQTGQTGQTGSIARNGRSGWRNVTKGLSGDYGFAAAIHPRDAATAYVFPLEDSMRMTGAAGGVYRTTDGGTRWVRQARGLPRGARYEVMREGLATDGLDPVGVYFGTTSGELWASADEGRSWSRIAEHLPAILSVGAVIA